MSPVNMCALINIMAKAQQHNFATTRWNTVWLWDGAVDLNAAAKF